MQAPELNIQSLLSNMFREASRRAEMGDEFFLVRQREYWIAAYQACGCGKCGGCNNTMHGLAAIEQAIEAVEAGKPTQCDRAREKARNTMAGEADEMAGLIAQARRGHETLRKRREEKRLRESGEA